MMDRSIRVLFHLNRARFTGFVRKCSASTTATSGSSSNTIQQRKKEPINATTPPLPSSSAFARERAVTFGQPTSGTHPHLLRNDELCPAVAASEFSVRRNRLMQEIQRSASAQPNANNLNNKRHVVIVPSANRRYMSDKIPYVFRQNSDFFYLSGCLEEDTVLVLLIDAEQSAKSVLFMRPKDVYAELWDGPRTGIDGAVKLFGVEDAHPVAELKNFIHKLPGPFTLWFNRKNCDLPNITTIVDDFLRSAKLPYEDPAQLIQRQRLLKSATEIQLMRRTCAIASAAINETMRETRPDLDTEHQVFARVDYKCRMAGANRLAYPPVVAAGRNATIIHYVQNTQLVRAGEMVLMDAGCEYGGYSSDITRTWPAGGRFSDAQRVLYEVVWQLQHELIGTLCRDGGRTLDELFDTMCLRLGQLLQEAGLVKRTLAGGELVRAAFSFCPHHVSHYLGMDVHDTPLMSRQLPLRPGMVCTVEPGVYIDAMRADVPAEFRGVGVRIEDDVLIGENGDVEVLTQACVKEPRELEALVVSDV